MNTDPSTSTRDLEILKNFLGAFDLSASAHARVDLSDREKKEIESLSRGDSSADQRSALVPLLAKNENAIELLATLLKKAP